PTPSSPLFPYTTLFRSPHDAHGLESSRRPRRDQGAAHRHVKARLAEDPVGSTELGVVVADHRCRRAVVGIELRPHLAPVRGEERSEEHTSELQSLAYLV